MKHNRRLPYRRAQPPLLGTDSVRKAADSFAINCLRLIANHGATGADIQKMIDSTKEPAKRLEIEAAFGRVILKQLAGKDISENAQIIQFPSAPDCPHGTSLRYPCEECENES
jgi:uncharacterized protein YqfA (UPF0365 family)